MFDIMIDINIIKGEYPLEKLFKLKENHTNVRTEIVAGITTFLAMAYILAVNPSILSASGMPSEAIFAATAISAAFATLIMAFFANYPVVLASGMGLNAYFAFSVVPQLSAQGIKDAWQVALTAILCEGVIFIILSFFKFRETLVNKVPQNLKLGISAGIGLFIAIIGLKGANIVVSDSSTLVALGNLGSPEVVLAFVGILIIAALWHFKVKGAILIGIVATWIFGIIAELTGWYQVNVDAGVYSVIPNFDNYAVFAPVQSMAENTFCKFNFSYIASNTVNFLVILFAFLFVDLFDTVGTLIGVAHEGKLLKSTTGVAEGGKTGLTALTSAVLFILALPLYPIFLAIPSFATTPALVFVGLLMLKNVTKMDFDSDIADSVGGFCAVTMMPFSYSIANGIMFGIISWVILKVVTGKIKEIHPVMWISFALFALRIVTIVLGIAS